MQELVEKYVKLRDAKAEIVAKHKAKLAEIDQVLSQIEASLLEAFNANGLDSVRTPAGTAYKSTRTSATVADWEATLNYVRENQLWALLERRVSKVVVEQFKEEHGELPPGIDWRSEVVLNVRRAA